MPPTVLFQPPQLTHSHPRTHTHWPEENLTVSRKVFNHSKWSFAPFLAPLFPLPPPAYAKQSPIYLSVVHPSFLLSISLLILSLFYCCCTYWASSPSLLMSIAASFYFLSFRHQCVHSSIHHSMRTKPLSNTDRQTPSLSYFPYKLFPTTKNEKLSLSLSILYHTNPPLTASTHISTHFWLWASDTHLFVSLHKSLKDPQMCAPLISISKKNHLPPSIIHLSVHPLLQTHCRYFKNTLLHTTYQWQAFF